MIGMFQIQQTITRTTEFFNITEIASYLHSTDDGHFH